VIIADRKLGSIAIAQQLAGLRFFFLLAKSTAAAC